MKRIAILVNKNFEYSGFIEGLRDKDQVYAGTNGRDAECRFENLIVDIYCIQNLFKEGENSSNSELKYGYLKDLFKSNVFRIEECDGILSFSTSESTPINQGADGNESKNGCVYVGNTFFLSDQQENDPTTRSHLQIGLKTTNNTEIYYEHPICDNLYNILNYTKMNLKSAYKNSADNVKCVADNSFAGVGVVNVMDYSCYKVADEIAYNKFNDMHGSNGNQPIGIETTHGVVIKALNDLMCEMKMKAEMPSDKDIPVNFISPIVDRYLKFDEDVDGKYGKQNYICSYNGGVVTGHILKILNKNYGDNNMNKKLYFVTVLCYNEGGCCACGRETVFVTDIEERAKEYKDGLMSGKYKWPINSDCDRFYKDAENDISIISCDYNNSAKGWII